MFSIHCKYSISHRLIDVHLYKFFTCLDINKICLKHLYINHSKEGRMVDIDVASLMEGEWFCYKGGLFNGGGMVMLERWAVLWRENGQCRW